LNDTEGQGKAAVTEHRRSQQFRTGEADTMNTNTGMAAPLLFLTLSTASFGQDHVHSPEHLGKVEFANSCAPAVQATF
jgi:hypothetical protein